MNDLQREKLKQVVAQKVIYECVILKLFNRPKNTSLPQNKNSKNLPSCPRSQVFSLQSYAAAIQSTLSIIFKEIIDTISISPQKSFCVDFSELFSSVRQTS